jgi:Protein of unknown function (DUF2934)
MTPKKSDIPKAAAKPRKRTTIQQVPTPSHEEIAKLAEKYWAERGWPQGSPEEDWLRAEQELIGKAS